MSCTMVGGRLISPEGIVGFRLRGDESVAVGVGGAREGSFDVEFAGWAMEWER